ncbi:MAG: hypothetical protein HOK28_20415 [Deltaproteobacteria bacterium]|nr:hypothetical protein [Deltaproteobacteria bacterium]
MLSSHLLLLTLPLLAYASLYVTIRCAYCYDWAAKPMAMLWYFLQNKANVVMFGPPIEKDGTSVQEMLNTYGNLFYWIMLYDEERMKAYTRGLQEFPKDRTLLDIGTGKHMPLARLALENGAKKVVAIEGNHASYSYAKKLRDSDSTLQDKLTLIHGISQDVELDQSYQLNGLVHEIIGTIASDEGFPKFVADARRRFLQPNSVIIPQRVSTLAVPVQDPAPFTNFSDRIISTLFGGEPTMITTPNVQCVCNPPLQAAEGKPMYLSQPKECESWSATEEGLQQNNTVVYPVEQDGVYSGFYMAPMADLGSKGQLDALTNITSWGIMYIRTVNNPVSVNAGDAIHLSFKVDCSQAVPQFHVQTSIENSDGSTQNAGAAEWIGTGLIVGKNLW